MLNKTDRKEELTILIFNCDKKISELANERDCYIIELEKLQGKSDEEINVIKNLSSGIAVS